MRIEILYFESCPHHRPTVAAVRELLRDAGIDAEIRELEVSTTEDAEALRFLGSPTVRVDGVDVEPAARDRNEYSLSCRMYGSKGIPPRDLLRSAITTDHGESGGKRNR